MIVLAGAALGHQEKGRTEDRPAFLESRAGCETWLMGEWRPGLGVHLANPASRSTQVIPSPCNTLMRYVK